MLTTMFSEILRMSFTASFAIAFVLLVRLFLKKVPKIFSYALWSVVLFRLICPFSFVSARSLLPANVAPLPQNIAHRKMPQMNTDLSLLSNAVNSNLPTVPGSMPLTELLLWVGSLLWLLGIAVLLTYSIITLIRLQKRLQGATLCENNIFISPQITTAFIIGFFRPKIYLPGNLDNTERDYILLHEQTHIKRYDHVFKFFSFFALCLHWFNPLVWLAFFFSGKDMEMCCDEAVIGRLGKDVKKEYASLLLTLATGKRILGGAPLAFGEGDTKDRIKNVLNYKKPTFWVGTVAFITVICVVMGLMTNPQEKPTGFTGINAIILEINEEIPSMTVMGVDGNSILGDQCILTWEQDALITVGTNGKPTQLALDDFAVGDSITLSIDHVQETYPSRTKATTIQLQPKETQSYPTAVLWEARTQFIGNNAAVGKLIGLLPTPQGLQYDHFELQTAARPYQVDLVYTVSTNTLVSYNAKNAAFPAPLEKNALLLLALIENADEIQVTLTDGHQKVSFIGTRAWAEDIVGGDVITYGLSPEKLQELVDFPLPESTQES